MAKVVTVALVVADDAAEGVVRSTVDALVECGVELLHMVAFQDKEMARAATYEMTHEGGIEAFTANIVEALEKARGQLPAAGATGHVEPEAVPAR